MRHVVIVEATTNSQQELAYGLTHAGLQVNSTRSIDETVQLAKRDPVDLVLLMKTCAGEEGFIELLRLRELASFPVICLSTQSCTADEIMGLELGADDYLVQPFHVDVLVARIKAVLRRARPEPSPGEPLAVLSVGEIVLDRVEHTVMIRGCPVALRRREFQLLRAFLEHPGEVLSITDLLTFVWGSDYSGQPQVVYVTIRWLRQKIEEDPKNPRLIVTVPSVGYKLNCAR